MTMQNMPFVIVCLFGKIESRKRFGQKINLSDYRKRPSSLFIGNISRNLTVVSPGKLIKSGLFLSG